LHSLVHFCIWSLFPVFFLFLIIWHDSRDYLLI
jgi:hypothetical protein